MLAHMLAGRSQRRLQFSSARLAGDIQARQDTAQRQHKHLNSVTSPSNGCIGGPDINSKTIMRDKGQHVASLLLLSLLWTGCGVFPVVGSQSTELEGDSEAAHAARDPIPVPPRPLPDLGVETTTGAEEPETEEAEEDNTDNELGKRQFSWRDHDEDHSVYAARSLMSASRQNSSGSMENPLGEPEPQDPRLERANFVEKEWQLMFRSWDLLYERSTSSLLAEVGKRTSLFDEIVGRLSPGCRRDVLHVRDSAKKHRLWALRMLDSNGRLPSGISYGRFSSPGDYEQCLGVHVDELVTSLAPGRAHQHRHTFNGKYCLLDFRLPMPERPTNRLLSIHEPVIDLSNTELGRKFPELRNYSGYASVFYEIGYLHAFCMPDTCEVSEVARALGQTLDAMHIIVNNTVDCEVRPQVGPQADSSSGYTWRASQLISGGILVVVFANSICASLVLYLRGSAAKTGHDGQPAGPKETGKQADRSHKVGLHSKKAGFYGHCFALQTNFERLTKPDPRGLTFVHYTRIVAMGLTVITHTAGMGTLQAITKPADASNSEQIFRDLLPQMLANAFTSIQIFFFMAGFMLVISTYPAVRRARGQLSFAEYAVKRAIRLMPGLAATICLNFLWPLLVDGPMLTYFVRIIVEPCESNWWRTLSFLSNFDHVERMCLRHSYFSASDYQLHMMAFPLLVLLHNRAGLALGIAGALTVAGFAAQVIMVLTKVIMPFMMIDYIDKQAFFNVVHYIHHPVWNHLSAFFYGFIIGYLVVRQVRVKLGPRTVRAIWLLLIPAGVVSIFAPYFWNHYKRPMAKWQMVVYVLVDRFVLLTTCAWLSYASMVLARGPKKASQPAPAKPVDGPTLASVSVVQISSSLSSSDKAAQEPPEVAPKAAPKRAAQVSNLNTLCLVLSRLTFQLYLFNMVVLWVDVNHSKYHWFFSYYFIITKALAVYICSSLMAMVFFVTLESPSLTLYIAWVRSRAARAARRQGPPASGKEQEPQPAQQQQRPQEDGAAGERAQPCGGPDGAGLCMRGPLASSLPAAGLTRL